MARYTSILLPLAQSRKKRLQEIAQARGETLETFILEAAEAEAARLSKWLSKRGHSVDHQIYASMPGTMRSEGHRGDGEHQVAAQQVALELGWDEGPSEAWLQDVDRLIEGLELLESGEAAPVLHAPTSHDARGSDRRSVSSVQVLNPVRGVVLDMSETGLGIETEGPFSVPEQVQLSIGQAMCCAKVRAEVRWCALTRTERFGHGDVIPIYRSGLSFVGN